MIQRRDFLGSLAALAAQGSPLHAADTPSGTSVMPAARSISASPLDQAAWEAVDAVLKKSWDAGLTHATERETYKDSRHNLMFLPFPYYGPMGPGQLFGYMFAWDTPDFTSRALMAHGRYDLALDHFKNYLFMIDRIGYMPNANSFAASTRSQTPLFPDTLWRYYMRRGDRDLIMMAYPILKRNFRDYWNAPHHQTPTGLCTNRDLGDPVLPPALAAEAETGQDWTPIYGGDVRRCVPLITNCALVRYARILGLIARELGISAEAAEFLSESERRSELIRRYCWDDERGIFLEYDYLAGRRLPCFSYNAYWTLWAEVATKAQAATLVDNLPGIEYRYGLACTDTSYPPPRPAADYAYPGSADADGRPLLAPEARPETAGGRGQLQWMYPVAFAPTELIPIEGLSVYGYATEAARIAAKYLGMVLAQYQRTGELWEKYNVVDGSLVMPNSRYGNVPMRGWTAAAVVLLGRMLFKGQSLRAL